MNVIIPLTTCFIALEPRISLFAIFFRKSCTQALQNFELDEILEHCLHNCKIASFAKQREKRTVLAFICVIAQTQSKNHC